MKERERTPSFERRIPEGETVPRMVCRHCGFVHYENPKIVVGAICALGERILLCRRAIEPRTGFWTMPAGYLELRETCEEGAMREVLEETGGRIEIDTLLAVYSLPHVSQVQLVYRARMLSDEIAPGPESLDVGFFLWEEIPWKELAFPTVHWALHHYRETLGRSEFRVFSNPPGERGERMDFGEEPAVETPGSEGGKK